MQLPTLLYLFMSFLELKPCIQHCKFIEGSALRVYWGGREADTSVGFIDIKVFRVFYCSCHPSIASSVKFFTCLRFRFIPFPTSCYHNFLFHCNLTQKRTMHREQTSVPSIKAILSTHSPPLFHYRSIFLFFFGVIGK